MTPTPTLSRQLARFIAAARLDDIPARVRSHICDDLLDIAGVVVFGFELPWGVAIADYVSSLDEPPRASVWGTGVRGSAGSAALAMALAGHAFELDDYHAGSKLHAATVVAPAVVAVAEDIGASGADTLLATILGMEVMVRLGLAADAVETMLNGFHLTGICGSAGAAAGVAKLLGLSEDQIAHALGLGATQAAGLMGFLHDGSESKRLHAGRAAQNGILAAQLAKRGMTGPPRAFELEHGGFLHAFSPAPKPELLVEDLGTHWTTGEISFKRYPVCGAIHSTVDSVRQAMADAGGRAIRSVRVGHSPAIVRQNGWEYEPSDQLHAQMSLRYSVAATIAEGELLPHQFRTGLIADPAVMEIVQRVEVVPDDRVAALYPQKSASCVTVELEDGTTREYFAETPKGSPENPLSFGEIEEKFRRLAAPRLGSERCDEVIAATRDFAGLPSVEPFVAPLRERTPAMAGA